MIHLVRFLTFFGAHSGSWVACIFTEVSNQTEAPSLVASSPTDIVFASAITDVSGNDHVDETVGQSPNRVLYAIATSEHANHASNRIACLKTWAAGLPHDQVLVVGARSEISNSAMWNPAVDCPDTHAGGACKDAVAIATARALQVSWLVLVGDDNYVFVDNLESELRRHDPNVPVIIGIKGCAYKYCAIGGLCGGGGQIFSRAMLQLMVSPNPSDFFEEHHSAAASVGMWGDVASCVVASKRHGQINGGVRGFYGWPLLPQQQLAAMTIVQPLPLTFHYMNAESMARTHLYWMQIRRGSMPQPHASIIAGNEEETDFVMRQDEYVATENSRREFLNSTAAF
eukprot:TRINITY_DN63232_c0_g1_i1.p1 TRINITY_DN63232_c0_g1~~TRINITY_DN63232_c0_g1_i1.p1  ORF type:complete len:342 (+),score=48.46 TRINITY_DN63232_c0_g1_i1:220-1245(+)